MTARKTNHLGLSFGCLERRETPAAPQTALSAVPIATDDMIAIVQPERHEGRRFQTDLAVVELKPERGGRLSPNAMESIDRSSAQRELGPKLENGGRLESMGSKRDGLSAEHKNELMLKLLGHR